MPSRLPVASGVTGKALLEPKHPAPPPLPPVTAALLLLLTATLFASNHIAARLAFDHGTSVATAVTVRSATTVLVGLGMLWSDRARPCALPGGTLSVPC